MGKKNSNDPRCAALGQAVKKIRVQRGMTQEMLAEKAEIDTSYIGQIERGLKYPSLKVLFRVADALNVKPIDFFLEV